MPRVSLKQAKLNRQSIIENAARLFRQRGFRNIPLSEVMSTSGLTLGGFYGHFESKDALTNEACRHSFEQTMTFWQEKIAAAADMPAARKSIIDDYLSERRTRKDHNNCPVVAFSNEVSQEDAGSTIAATYAEGLAGLIKTYTQTLVEDAATIGPELESQALLEMALMIGSLSLARATRNQDLSSKLLHSARHFLGVEDAPVQSA